ncbi:hypothetical protein FHS15_002878 [Paenibacillus castaneae]|uniref:hypothetical protein n=1 Tax=Paenibacillus castaneae TaxID=474957 RepID=UPI000C9D0586|nr:hypothetical protein [Paenibacillus castaneae]NIK77740.1 hypothetical protein [Paenibacillus castaneae]
MKKHYLIVFALLFMILIIGCSEPKKVKTDQLDEFKTSMVEKHKQINNLKIQFVPTNVRFIYEMKKGTEEANREEIFAETRDIVQSAQFQDEVIKSLYIKMYPGEENYPPPSITINFEIKQGNKKETEYHKYTSYYNAANNEATPEEKETGYQRWMYTDSKGEEVEIP